MTESPRPFVAFISYSHRDTQWAAWIQKAVERYRLPKALCKETGLDKRIGKVFRDREELATGQNLGDHLLAALDNSDNLIVICSPNAVNSQWVGQEIEYFKSIGRGDRIFCLLVEGGAESLPEPLLTDIEGNPLEPLAADPRESGDGKRLAKLKLISGILGVKLDQLTRREQARQNQLRLVYTGIASFMVFMSAAAFVSYQQQQLAKQQEAFERETAMENAANMVEFAKRIGEQIDVESRALVNSQLIEYLERSGTDTLDTSTQRYLAQAYQQLGYAKLQQGTDETSIVDQAVADEALNHFIESAKLYTSVLRSDPNNQMTRFDAGVSDFFLGYGHLRRAEFEKARAPFTRYEKAMSELFAEDPNNPDFIFENAAAKQAILRLRLLEETSFTPSLQAAMEEAVAAAKDAVQRLPDNPDMHDAAAVGMNMAASALARDCFYSDPRLLDYRSAAQSSAAKSYELRPRSREAKGALSEMNSALAHTFDALGMNDRSLEAYLNAYRMRVELADTDPTNKFAATQVVKSRLDVLQHHTHTKSSETKGFTAQQALKDFGSASGRKLAQQSNLEIYWLLYFAESAIVTGDNKLAGQYVSELRELVTSALGDSVAINPRLVYMTDLLSRTLKLSASSSERLSESISVPEAMDCRSRINRWLAFSLNGDSEKAELEREALRNNNVQPLYLSFYDDLVHSLKEM